MNRPCVFLCSRHRKRFSMELYCCCLLGVNFALVLLQISPWSSAAGQTWTRRECRWMRSLVEIPCSGMRTPYWLSMCSLQIYGLTLFVLVKSSISCNAISGKLIWLAKSTGEWKFQRVDRSSPRKCQRVMCSNTSVLVILLILLHVGFL
jgi:hypothetical protein